MRGLLDTSVFVAGEQGRPLAGGNIPDEAAISIVTLAELELGVHLAPSQRVRSLRLATLGAVRSGYSALPIDEAVASSFAGVVAAARRDGTRVGVQDAWIGATALVHDVPVYTQDLGFAIMDGVQVIHV